MTDNQQYIIAQNKFLIYFLTFFIISYTFQRFLSNPVFKLPIMLIFLFFFFKYVKKINTHFLVVLGCLSLVIIVQGILYGYSFVSHISSLFFNVFIPYVLLMILPFNYHKYLINIVVILSVISLILWIGVNISSSLHSTIQMLAKTLPLDYISENYKYSGDKEQLLIFTYEEGTTLGFIRNAGFCHEPGAFAVILIYVLVFNTFFTHRLFNKANMLFIICIISTFSTAGIISLFIFLFCHIYSTKKISVFVKILLLFLLLLCSFRIAKLDFMQEKIVEQYDYAKNISLQTETSGRFLGARKAIVSLSRHPLCGRGFCSVSKVKDYSSAEAYHYGFMSYFASVGVILSVLTILLFYKGLTFWYRITGFNKNNKFCMYVFAFVPVLFAQSFVPSVLFNMVILGTYLKYYQVNKNLRA